MSKESLESLLEELGKSINERKSQIKPLMEELEKCDSDFNEKMESCKSALYGFYKDIFETVGDVFSNFIGLPYIDRFKEWAKYKTIKQKGEDGKTIKKKVIKKIVFETGYKTAYYAIGEMGLITLFLTGILYPFYKLGLIWVENDFVITSKKNYFKGRCGRKRSFDWFFNKKICKFFKERCRHEYLNADYLIKPIDRPHYDVKYKIGRTLIDCMVDFKDSEEYKHFEIEKESKKEKLEKLNYAMNKFSDKLDKLDSEIEDFEKAFSEKNSKES